jgi:hypothetical protein
MKNVSHQILCQVSSVLTRVKWDWQWDGVIGVSIPCRETIERDGPCWLLKLRWMSTHRVHRKGLLPWLVNWACCHAGTRDFCSALAALVSPVQNIFSSPYDVSIPLFLSPSKLGGQSCCVACLLVCISGWYCSNFCPCWLWPENIFLLWLVQ